MPTVKSFAVLVKYLANVFLVFLAVFTIVKMGGWGVVRMVIPSVASDIYSIVDIVVVGIAYLFLLGLFGIAVYLVVNYLRNRGKLDKPSMEAEAIIELKNEIAKLRKELKCDKSKRG